MLFRSGGNLAANGAVAWMFERRGVFFVDPAAGLGEDALLELVLEVGAEDLQQAGGAFTISCALADFATVQKQLQQRGTPLRSFELAYVSAQRAVVAELELARRVMALLDELEDNDDVQSVHSNVDFPDAVAKALGES